MRAMDDEQQRKLGLFVLVVAIFVLVLWAVVR